MKIYSAHQSSFLPWIGYWEKVYTADFFDTSIYDQFTPSTWQNYSFINTAKKKKKWGLSLLNYSWSDKPNIRDIKIVDGFGVRLAEEFKNCHSGDKYFETIFPLVSDWLMEVDKIRYLWEVNLVLFERIYKLLNLKTRVVYSPKEVGFSASEDIIFCSNLYNCSIYFSGPHGKNYLDIEKFKREGVEVLFQDSADLYHNYPCSIVSTISEIGLQNVLKILEERKNKTLTLLK